MPSRRHFETPKGTLTLEQLHVCVLHTWNGDGQATLLRLAAAAEQRQSYFARSSGARFDAANYQRRRLWRTPSSMEHY